MEEFEQILTDIENSKRTAEELNRINETALKTIGAVTDAQQDPEAKKVLADIYEAGKKITTLAKQGKFKEILKIQADLAERHKNFKK